MTERLFPQRVAYLQQMLGVRLDPARLDEPLSDEQLATARPSPRDPRSAHALTIARQGWSLRDVLAHGVIDYHPAIVGPAVEAADHMQEWFEAGARRHCRIEPRHERTRDKSLNEKRHENWRSRNRAHRQGVVDIEKLFDGAFIHPREVVKMALSHNAAVANLKPSTADRRITQKLVDALRLVEIRVLDHMVIGSDEVVSFAERGLI